MVGLVSIPPAVFRIWISLVERVQFRPLPPLLLQLLLQLLLPLLLPLPLPLLRPLDPPLSLGKPRRRLSRRPLYRRLRRRQLGLGGGEGSRVYFAAVLSARRFRIVFCSAVVAVSHSWR